MATPEIINAFNALGKLLGVGTSPLAAGGTAKSGYSSNTPDQVAKAPLPTPSEDATLVVGVSTFLDKTYPISGAPVSSMYPSAAKLHDAFVYAGTTLAKVTAFYAHCFGTGAYGPVTGAPMVSNNQARNKAFTVTHGAIDDQLVTYCSFVQAPLPEKNQLV